MGCGTNNDGMGVKKFWIRCDICGYKKNYKYADRAWRQAERLVAYDGWITNGYKSYDAPFNNAHRCSCKKKGCAEEFKNKYKPTVEREKQRKDAEVEIGVEKFKNFWANIENKRFYIKGERDSETTKKVYASRERNYFLPDVCYFDFKENLELGENYVDCE